MEENSPEGGTKQGDRESSTDNNKKQINWGTVGFLAFTGIIEVFSLVLWQEAEDFNGIAAIFIHWISKCGFLFGAAIIAHKYSKKPIWVWVFYTILCLCMLAVPFLKPANSESPAPAKPIF